MLDAKQEKFGGRDAQTANFFMDNLAQRLADPIQLTTDGHAVYLDTVAGAFADDVGYATLVKLNGEDKQARPAPSANTARMSASALARSRRSATPIPGTSARPTSNGRTSRCGWACAASRG